MIDDEETRTLQLVCLVGLVLCARRNEAKHEFVVYRNLFDTNGDRPGIGASRVQVDVGGDSNGVIV